MTDPDHLIDRIAALEALTGMQAPAAAAADNRQQQAAGLALVAALGADGRGQHEDAAALRKEAAARQEIGTGPGNDTPPGGRPDPDQPPPDFKRDAVEAARSFGFGPTATLVFPQQEKSAMSGTVPEIFEQQNRRSVAPGGNDYTVLRNDQAELPTATFQAVAEEVTGTKGSPPIIKGEGVRQPDLGGPDGTPPSPSSPPSGPAQGSAVSAQAPEETKAVSDPAFQIEVRPVVYPTPGGTVMGLEQANSRRSVATDYEGGPTRNGDPDSQIPVEIEPEPATVAAAITEATPPSLAQQVEDLQTEAARHGISQQDADTLGTLQAALADQQPAPAMDQDATPPALQHDEGPPPDDLWSKTANEAVQAQNARDQSVERPEGDNINSNGGEAPPMSAREQRAAKLEAIARQLDATPDGKGAENEAGPEGAAAAFRGFGR